MAIRPEALSVRDRKLCQRYLQEMRSRDAAAHEPWTSILNTGTAAGNQFRVRPLSEEYAFASTMNHNIFDLSLDMSA
jgi:hypothetical protein